MLARRFSIVCLAVVLFGAALSILVAEASRPAGIFQADAREPCLFEQSPACSDFGLRRLKEIDDE